jgi:hypothetical protein
MNSISELFDALLQTPSSTEVTAILRAIGDRPDIGIGNSFDALGLSWHPVGNNLSNNSTVNLATKPGRSLSERITNAVDAVLEDRVRPGIALPNDPRVAAQQWFGRPVSGPDEGLFRWDYSKLGIDRRIAVVLNNSGNETAPTVDVIDDGIGIQPDQFSNTILSLQGGNKIQRPYLMGLFGQGGSSTLGFSDYVLVISRHRDAPEKIGFTLIRILALDATYRDDAYAYLVVGKDSHGTPIVPSVTISTESLKLYQQPTASRIADYRSGTIVRHYGFKLPNLDATLGASPGNLYHYLHASLFDPILPFRLLDLRNTGKEKDEIVTGSRNRLMKLVEAAEAADEGEGGGSKSKLRHYRPMEFVVPLGAALPCVGIEYWVVLNHRKVGDRIQLRGQSNELYLQRGHPIIGTLNGQNQGELTASVLRELNLGMVAKHIVIHIDATNADRKIRRELFVATREGFKEGPVLNQLIQVLKSMLQDDEQLFAIERELTEKLASRENESTNEEVKKQVTKLLLEAGLQPSQEGPKDGKGDNIEIAIKPPRPPHPPVPPPPPPPPLATLPFPQVTRFEIVSPQLLLRIHIGEVATIRCETDADAEYDRQERIAVRSEPEHLELAAKSLLRGGRMKWRLRPTANAKAGDTGKLVVTVTRPDGSQIAATLNYELLPQREERTKPTRGIIPPFEIFPIDPVTEPERWAQLWPDLSDAATPEEQTTVAYKQTPAGGGIYVFYSTIFSPFRAQLERLKVASPTMAGLFETTYQIWIGYHAILQQMERTKTEQLIGEEKADDALEAERVRVAVMQVKQSLKTAELMHKLTQQQAAD